MRLLRFDAIDILSGTFAICTIVFALVMSGIGIYGTGYRNGQIDAQEGWVSWIQMETDGKVYWYREGKPTRLYPARNRKGD